MRFGAGLTLHHRKSHRRSVLHGMVHGVVRHHTLGLVVVIAAGVEVAVETREVAARYFDPDAVAGGEVIAGGHGLERHAIYFAGFQPGQRLVVSVAIAQAPDGLVQVVGRAVGVHVDQLHCEIGIFGIGRNMQRDADRTAGFDGLLERLGGVDQNVGPGLLFALIEGAARYRVTGAADVAAIAGHGVHGIVSERVGVVG